MFIVEQLKKLIFNIIDDYIYFNNIKTCLVFFGGNVSETT
jgi:hypothetical protein